MVAGKRRGEEGTVGVSYVTASDVSSRIMKPVHDEDAKPAAE